MKSNRNKRPEEKKDEARLLSLDDLENVTGGAGQSVPDAENPFADIPRVPTQSIDAYLRNNG